jgi:hypothetical protein
MGCLGFFAWRVSFRTRSALFRIRHIFFKGRYKLAERSDNLSPVLLIYIRERAGKNLVAALAKPQYHLLAPVAQRNKHRAAVTLNRPSLKQFLANHPVGQLSHGRRRYFQSRRKVARA